MKIMAKVWVAVVAMALLVSTGSRAADVVVSKTGTLKSSINLVGFSCGGAAAEVGSTLAADLERSGWFSVTEGGAAIRLTGTCRSDGATVRADAELMNVGASRSYFRRSYREDRRGARRVAHQLADDIVEAVRGVRGIASTRIAMIRSSGGRQDLFVCDADGGGVLQVTRDGAVCLDPAWTPDAKGLFYTSFKSGYPDVYEIDLSSNGRRRFAGFPGLNAGADVSPDGQKIALTLSKDGNPDIYVLPRGGRRAIRITHTEQAAEASPSWSPDGRQLVFVSDRTGRPHLYVADETGGAPARITVRGSENVSPDWGADGRIVYASKRDGVFQICVSGAGSNRGEVLLTRDYADHEEPSWAPDSRHVVYTRTSGHRSELYVLDTLGDPEIPLTRLEGNWHSPAWSP